MKSIWIDNQRTVAPWNLAAEEYLIHNRQGTIAMLWRNERSVIIGRNQDLHSEVDMDFAQRSGIAVVRRLTGGGAVFHDLGNVNYTYISQDDGNRSADFSGFAQPLIRALAQMGVTAEHSGRNDLLVDGRKVSGCAHTVMNGRSLFHGTLLFSADLSDMAGVLRVNEAKYKSKGIASVASRVGNLSEWLSTPEHPMDTIGFMQTLRALLLADGSFEPSAYADSEVCEIDRLCNEKYASMAWTDGGWRGAEKKGSVRTPGGTVEAWVTVQNGRIGKVRLTGDFFGEVPVAQVESRLDGLPYDREAVAAALYQAPLSQAMRNVPMEALLDALFGTNA